MSLLDTYNGLALNQMLADESEEYYGQMMTEETLANIEVGLNTKLYACGVTGIYIKVEGYDDNTFIVTPIIGEPTKNKKPDNKIEDWWK